VIRVVARRRNPAKVRPLMLWHATNRVFSRFDPDRSGLGTHFGTYRAAMGRLRTASKHGLRAKESDPWRATKYRVRIERPLRTVDIGGWDDEPNIEHVLIAAGVMTPLDLHVTRSITGADFWRWVRARIEAAGYDSIVYRNKVEDVGKDSYIVWRGDQIEYAPQPITNPSRRRARPMKRRARA